jgi:radical SAM protein with 4Fe4S-binding SPASM domain
MKERYNLSELKILAFEMGPGCNLKQQHLNCPINYIRRPSGVKNLTVKDVIKAIDDSVALGFNGYVAFHHYNEPLLYMNSIEQVVRERPHQKYLLWSNGLLIPELERMGHSLSIFNKIVLTCYSDKDYHMLLDVQSRYPDVEIGMSDMDDRVEEYESHYENLIACKKIFFELPIGFNGDVFLCAHDWKNSFPLGNIIKTSLMEVVSGEQYQTLLAMSRKRKLDENAPEICRHCKYAFLQYHKGSKLLLDK